MESLLEQREQIDAFDWADGMWREIGFNVAADGTKSRFFEMTLTRVADTADWPAPVPMDVGQDD